MAESVYAGQTEMNAGFARRLDRGKYILFLSEMRDRPYSPFMTTMT
jgi:hypothetical protein